MRALILAAGRGSRLGELCRDRPKPMLPIGGVPLVERSVRYLVAMGITDIGVNVHHLGEQIASHLGDGARLGARIRLLVEDRLTGTAGPARALRPFLAETDRFVVLYGDLLTDEDLCRVEKLHSARRALATMVVHRRVRSNSIVECAGDGQVTVFMERPGPEAWEGREWAWVNSGIYVMNREVLDRIPPLQSPDFPRDVFPDLVSAGALYCSPLTGYRCAIDSPERYREALAAWERHDVLRF